ncbi:uncharacterized protein LOC129750876 [Uranotaenia lowii]|uniref:uncharacterized protein LOC129750876 n=1 Tax=Uranotaenia lowii TaxID=190385 RepID=UPI0024793AD6|nr:uncharacterized protein LOC129750876 [Uranotaenia lowii]
MTIELDQFNCEYTKISNFTNLRVRKFNRTTAVLNGTYEMFIEMNNDHELECYCDRSALGNNQFSRYPLKLLPMPVCDFIKFYLAPNSGQFQNYTNFPRIPREGLCPTPKGEFYIKNLIMDSNKIPSVAPEGYYRCYFDIRQINPREELSRCTIYARIVKELQVASFAAT